MQTDADAKPWSVKWLTQWLNQARASAILTDCLTAAAAATIPTSYYTAAVTAAAAIPIVLPLLFQPTVPTILFYIILTSYYRLTLIDRPVLIFQSLFLLTILLFNRLFYSRCYRYLYYFNYSVLCFNWLFYCSNCRTDYFILLLRPAIPFCCFNYSPITNWLTITNCSVTKYSVLFYRASCLLYYYYCYYCYYYYYRV